MPPLLSLFEHSLPTLSLTPLLEEAHCKLLLRLVAEELDKEMEEDVAAAEDKGGKEEEVEEEDAEEVEDDDAEEEVAAGKEEEEVKDEGCISSPVTLLVLSCSPDTAKGSVLVESRVMNLDVGCVVKSTECCCCLSLVLLKFDAHSLLARSW